MAWWNTRQPSSPGGEAWLRNEAPGREPVAPLWRRLLLGERRAVYPWNVWGQDQQYLTSMTTSGTAVNEVTAFKFNIVYASITLIADGVASLTPQAFVEADDGTLTPGTVPQWVRKPHPEIRRFDMFNQLLVSTLAWGDGIALFVKRPSDGVVVGLDMQDPADVTIEWDPNRPGFRRYKVKNGPWLTSRDVLHVMGPTLPGRASGMSVISQAREAIGLGLTLEEFGSRYFAQGSQAKVVLTVPNRQVGDDEAKQIIRTFERWHRGKGNWHRPALASGGATIQNISIPPDDAQFLQSREFQATTVASWFRVPPHRVGIVGATTSWGSGLAEENMAMLQHTFRPWILRLENALTAYSPGGDGAGTLIKLDDSILQRGTFKEAADTWSALVQMGVATPDEARVKLGLKPMGGEADKLRDPSAQQQQQPGGNQPSDGATPSRTKEQDRIRKQQEAARFNSTHDAHSGKFASHAGAGAAGELSTMGGGGLSADGQEAMSKLYADTGTSPAAMQKEIESKLTPEYLQQGKDWYPHANAVAADIAQESGLSHEQSIAILAAVSPQKKWDVGAGNNIEVARYIATNHRKWADVPADKVGLVEVTGRDGKSTVKLHSRLVTADREIGIAVNIARADSRDPVAVHHAIDQNLTGVKRRSFYNNMRHPGKTEDVTVDTWMARAISNSSKTGITINEVKGKLYAAEVSTKGGSGYRAVADATRAVAHKLGMSPDEVQAAYWTAVKNDPSSKKRTSKAAMAAAKARTTSRKQRLTTGKAA